MKIDQRLYTAKIGHIFISICLSMFPVTALAFLFVKFTGGYFEEGQSSIYRFYFITWLLIALYYSFKRDNYNTNKSSLLLGSIFGFMIPIANGVISDNWIWTTFKDKQFDIFMIDALWIILATIAIAVYFKINPKIKQQSSFSKHPIDYDNINELRKEEAKENKQQTNINNFKNEIPMKTKITMLWFFSAIGWIAHHIYGLFNIYYNETLIMDGATGEAPLEHHLYRIAFEGFSLLFALMTIEMSNKIFKEISFGFAIIAGLYNLYHLSSSFMYDATNVSELFILTIMLTASVLLVKNIVLWKKEIVNVI